MRDYLANVSVVGEKAGIGMRHESNDRRYADEHRLFRFGAGENTPDCSGLVVVHDISHTGVGTSHQCQKTDQEHTDVDRCQKQVAGFGPLALLDENEPHQGGEVEGEAGDEEGRGDGQKVVEEGDDFGDDKRDDGGDGDDNQPGDPAHRAVDESDGRVLVDATVDQAAQDDGVDGTTDEDDREGDTEGDAADQAPCREQRGTLDAGTDKGVDQGTGHSVDDDFHNTQRPDRLDVVLGGVHLVHERELAHGETVGENDVGQGDEGIGESGVRLGPSRPVNSRQPTGGVGGLDTGRNDGDTNGGDNGDKVDVSENSDLGKTWGNGDQQQNDGGNHGEDDGADTTLSDVLESNGTGESVGAREEQQLQNQHDSDKLITKTTHYELSGVGIVGNQGKLQLHLADHITGVNGNQTDAHGTDNAGDHTQGRESRRNRQTSEGNSLDDEDNGETLPAQTVELLDTMLVDVLFALTDLADHITIVDGRRVHLALLLAERLHGLVGGVGNVFGGAHDRKRLYSTEDEGEALTARITAITPEELAMVHT